MSVVGVRAAARRLSKTKAVLRDPEDLWRCFPQEKRELLAKDKSSKGSWDSPIAQLLARINSLEEFCTLSSCSGRAYLWTPSAADLPTPARGAGAAPSLPRRVPRKCVAPETWRFHVVHDVEEWDPERHLRNGAEIPAPDEVVWARFEPFVLHVACRSLGTALGLVEASRRSFPRSSLLSFRRRFVVQIPGEDYVDLPYFFSARELNAPDRETFARYVASVMEDKFEANARRIRTLEADLAHLASGPHS
ncbi:unnamed protein product [Effrenium voratum]|uniref:tRNA(Phe) 7-[(3-amino-3-carboxypropyl)-4-demethylwyosine(37)-N(4)]-methyltransferase n=1 Tax=Effrenium voratum TaxID=2562239 RepID=A0AA36J5F6_9DINO|nr:unnamed protein product [Effrenium voratum]